MAALDHSAVLSRLEAIAADLRSNLTETAGDVSVAARRIDVLADDLRAGLCDDAESGEA